MIYYFILAIVDIYFFLTDHWKELTFTALASGIGVILGKRIGVKFAVNYIMKYMGMQQETKLEQQVSWLIKQEESRGNQWIAPISKPYRLNIHRILLKRSIWSRMARSIARFTKLRTNLRRKRMKQYLLKLTSRRFLLAILAVIMPVVNEEFGLELNTATIIAIIGGLASFIIGESHVDAKKAVAENAKYQDSYQSNQ